MKAFKILTNEELESLKVQGGVGTSSLIGVFHDEVLQKLLPGQAAEHIPAAAIEASPALGYVLRPRE